ncbi:MAG: efflux RND transporter periplasmic adaptor subunit [Bacteroidales bacterium]|nr:efflux RND transporter periplasmic adaptor subunit [Bacteroidales bacterium]
MKHRMLPIVLAVSVALLPACHNARNDHHHEGEAHEHEPVLVLTSYSSDWEIFAESHPLVVGEEAPVLCHVTGLEDFKPYSGSNVTAFLKVGDSVMSTSAEPSGTPGIFNLSFTPDAEGEGSIGFVVEGDTLTVPVKSFREEEEAHEYAESLEVKSSNGAAFPKEKSWKVDFATEECRIEPFGRVIKTMARVMPSQGEEASVSALVDGIVSIPGGSLIEGREVSKGESLCRIVGSGMVEGNSAVRYAEAESECNFARSEYERKLKLSKDRIVSESELQRAKAEYESALARFNSLKFSKEGQNLVSPIHGCLTEVRVTNGQFVRTGERIATVSSSRKLNLVAEVQPRYLGSLKNITGATFKPMNGDTAWTLEAPGGTAIGPGSAVSQDNPLVPVTFSVDNKADFIPGSFVQVWVKTAGEAPVVTVASSALVEELGNFFVYKQLTPEYFEKVPVVPGASDGLRTEIREGLQGGERLVTKGAVLVKLAQASGALDPHAGHTH